jgi:hypothetical protein
MQMPKRAPPVRKEKWDRRLRSKMGLMPLTSMKEISRRTGIPISFLQSFERPMQEKLGQRLI